MPATMVPWPSQSPVASEPVAGSGAGRRTVSVPPAPAPRTRDGSCRRPCRGRNRDPRAGRPGAVPAVERQEALVDPVEAPVCRSARSAPPPPTGARGAAPVARRSGPVRGRAPRMDPDRAELARGEAGGEPADGLVGLVGEQRRRPAPRTSASPGRAGVHDPRSPVPRRRSNAADQAGRQRQGDHPREDAQGPGHAARRYGHAAQGDTDRGPVRRVSWCPFSTPVGPDRRFAGRPAGCPRSE